MGCVACIFAGSRYCQKCMWAQQKCPFYTFWMRTGHVLLIQITSPRCFSLCIDLLIKPSFLENQFQLLLEIFKLPGIKASMPGWPRILSQNQNHFPRFHNPDLPSNDEIHQNLTGWISSTDFQIVGQDWDSLSRYTSEVLPHWVNFYYNFLVVELQCESKTMLVSVVVPCGILF